jgi:flagellar biosynthetic protein FliR
MLDWDRLTLFLYITVRMAGFILFTPFFGRSNVPNTFKAGFTLVLAVTASGIYTGEVLPMPVTLMEFAVRLILELGVGFLVGVVMNLFLFVPSYAGHIMDEQMGMAMAQTYDPSFQGQATPASNVLNIFSILIFFSANGHHTLLRLMLDSGGVVPFGTAALGSEAAEKVAALFIDCTLLSMKLCLPILGAELMGQVGMGVLMKAIPQINVFAINIELKVIIGLAMLYFMLAPISEFLLTMENTMLLEVEKAIALATGG